VKVKICGITSIPDALAAAGAGADAVGLVFAPSPRKVTVEAAREIAAALPPFVSVVGVFVNEESGRIREIIGSCGLHYVQFHGDETAETCNQFGKMAIRAVRMRNADSLRGLERYQISAILLDSYVEGVRGGTAAAFPWELSEGARRFKKPLILSGGLNAGNVAEAIKKARPYAVDVSSGVESAPGEKDHVLMAEFVRLAKLIPTTD